VRQINAKEFVSHYRPQDVPTTSNFEGQLVITATANGSNQSFDTGTIACLVKDMLRNYGEVLACEPAFTTLPNLMFRVEFFDSTAADAAVSGLNGFKLAVCFTPHGLREGLADFASHCALLLFLTHQILCRVSTLQ
jgi:hypothetical protein